LPVGRVHPAVAPAETRISGSVSILTRPEGRVQQSLGVPNANALAEFQSSPAPKDGCNAYLPVVSTIRREFQSSPAPKDGCNAQIGPNNAFPLPFSALLRLFSPFSGLFLTGKARSGR
ncbi:MAG: hypothetical protein QM346_11180, partial [Chloroflexota bacterium]|nr:hypothetical protein [Chloroflexota bacterium]